MKQLPLLLGLGSLVLASGCETKEQIVSEGSRAQTTLQTPAAQANAFVGLWTSPSSQTVNDWFVAFTPTGLIAVDGPGLMADGTYVVEGRVAKSAFAKRNGTVPALKDRETVFELSADAKSLAFSTGIPMDPVVKLVRPADDQRPLPRPSLQQTSDPTATRSPFTLAWVHFAG